MSCFVEYSRYYDLLYHDKNYEVEANYLVTLLNTHCPNGKRLCEFGSGTGRLAEHLAKRGYSVDGVELSSTMLGIAEQRKGNMLPEVASRISFTQGDIRDISMSDRFDAVISLFHVVSYQANNADLSSAFRSAAGLLESGGLFVFDFWYGPAVLNDPPKVRFKRVENDVTAILRIAEPSHHPEANVYDVRYTLVAIEKASKIAEIIEENHRMRYLFLPEIDLLLEETGFRRVAALEWLSHERTLHGTAWNGLIVSRKK